MRKRPRNIATLHENLQLIGVEIHPYDLDIAHQVPFHSASNGWLKRIVCKFTRHIAHDHVMASRREVNRIDPAGL